jgi:ketopantoate reductase
MQDHTHRKPSMLQDVRAGMPTEIEAICGTVGVSHEKSAADHGPKGST